MKSRVDELFNEYCKPKPTFHVELYDLEKVSMLDESRLIDLQQSKDKYIDICL